MNDHVSPRRRREVIDALRRGTVPANGLDLLAVGLERFTPALDGDLDAVAGGGSAFKAVRGKDAFDKIVRNVREFRVLQRGEGATAPRVSLWLTGLKETIGQLPAFVRLAQDIGIGEVYLQRLVYFEEGQGLARGQSSLFEQMRESEAAAIGEAEALAKALGISFNASGATEPEASLKKKGGDQL